jgi:hypothetical protein
MYRGAFFMPLHSVAMRYRCFHMVVRLSSVLPVYTLTGSDRPFPKICISGYGEN